MVNKEFFKPKESPNLLSNICVLERKVAICFRLHVELNFLMDTVEVVKEVPMPVRTLVCLTELLYSWPSAVIGSNRRKWQTHSHAVSLLV
jgi:hypothetical protein